MDPLVLRGVTLADSSSADVWLRDGIISRVDRLDHVRPSAEGPGAGAPGSGRDEDLQGYLVLPAAVEPHAHLDKAFLAELIENPTGDLMGAIDAMESNRHLLTVENTIERAERAALLLLTNGATSVRTHVDITTANGLTSLAALTEVKRRLANVMKIQIVGLFGRPILGAASADQRALAREAISFGLDVVGGCPHLEDDPRAATELYLSMAAEAGLAVDLHTDETLDANTLALVDLAELVLEGFPHPVTASHCVSLGMQPESTQQEVAERVAAAGISVVTLPHTNLYLQGRSHQMAMPRGLTALRALRSAGVNLAAGGDNLQDPFNPMGRGDPFETAALAVISGHLLPHHAYDAVSTGARRALGQAPIDIAAGHPADLVAVRSSSVREALAFQPAERVVFHAGRVVARHGRRGS
jgi:cytosine deaminase